MNQFTNVAISLSHVLKCELSRLDIQYNYDKKSYIAYADYGYSQAGDSVIFKHRFVIYENGSFSEDTK